MEPETRLHLVSLLVVVCGLLGLSRLLEYKFLGSASATPNIAVQNYHQLVDSARAELGATGQSRILESLLKGSESPPATRDTPLGKILHWSLVGAFGLFTLSGVLSLLGRSQVRFALYFSIIGLVFIPLVGLRAGINFLELSTHEFRWELFVGLLLCVLMLWVSRADRKSWKDVPQVRARPLQS